MPSRCPDHECIVTLFDDLSLSWFIPLSSVTCKRGGERGREQGEERERREESGGGGREIVTIANHDRQCVSVFVGDMNDVVCSCESVNGGRDKVTQ